jgi:hypothetical protein
MAKEIKGNKALNMCPTILPECPPKRDHGKGGPPEHKTACKGKHCDLPSDHGGQHPWPFQHKGSKKWDKKWTALESVLPRRKLLTLDEMRDKKPRADGDKKKIFGKPYTMKNGKWTADERQPPDIAALAAEIDQEKKQKKAPKKAPKKEPGEPLSWAELGDQVRIDNEKKISAAAKKNPKDWSPGEWARLGL